MGTDLKQLAAETAEKIWMGLSDFDHTEEVRGMVRHFVGDALHYAVRLDRARLAMWIRHMGYCPANEGKECECGLSAALKGKQ